MALIQRGSFESLSGMFAASVRESLPALDYLRTFSSLREATRTIQPAPIEFDVSSNARGIALKSLKLLKGFEGFLQNVFNRTQEVYFLSWSWDLSGAPVVNYPGASAIPQTCIIPLQAGDVRKFLGAGITLFPARKVTAGLATRIMIWESDHGARNFGKTMSEIANTVKASKLNNLLSVISLAAGTTTATVSLVKDAAIELSDLIGMILQANSDDYVDFYEGYYPAMEQWEAGVETHQGNASEITLTRLV